jgi:hypothetical protein
VAAITPETTPEEAMKIFEQVLRGAEMKDDG